MDDRGIFEKRPGSGVWYARWKQDGKICKKKIGPKSAAREYAEKMRAAVVEERLFPEKVAARRRARLTVELLIESYRAEWGRKESSADDDRYAAYWIEAIGKRLASEVTPGDIEAWRSRRLKVDQVRPATVNRATSFLRRIYNLGLRDRKLTCLNPVCSLFVPQLAEENQVFRILFDHEEEWLRARATMEEWLKIEFALLTGLRAGEQTRLRSADVDLSRARLWVVTGEGRKSKNPRQVPLSDRAVGILSALMDDGREYVWPGRFPGTHLQDNSLYRMLKRLCAGNVGKDGRANEILDLDWHALRHTFATRYLEDGGSIHDLKEIMGHSSIVVTQRYLTANLDRARVTMNRMANRNLASVETRKEITPGVTPIESRRRKQA